MYFLYKKWLKKHEGWRSVQKLSWLTRTNNSQKYKHPHIAELIKHKHLQAF